MRRMRHSIGPNKWDGTALSPKGEIDSGKATRGELPAAGQKANSSKGIKAVSTLTPGTPESFNVLVKELQSLCLDIRTEYKEGGGSISPAVISKEALREKRKERKKAKRKKI